MVSRRLGTRKGLGRNGQGTQPRLIESLGLGKERRLGLDSAQAKRSP